MNFKLRIKNRPGFTLIEMLIVVTIISIIAVLAVSSFADVRQNARLNVTADSLVTAFQEQQQKAKNGSGGCFGLSFNNSDDPIINYFSLPYVRVSGDKIDLCEGDMQKSANGFVSDLKLKELLINQTTPYDSGEIAFKPPFGKPVFRSGGNFLAFDSLFISIGFENSDDERCILFDSATGNVKNVSCT